MISNFLPLVVIFASAQGAPPIKVVVDAKPVAFHDVQPLERHGRVYVPLKGVFERLGAAITFDEAAKVVRVKYGEKEIEVPIGEGHAYLNGTVTVNGGTAIVVNGRAMVPLRFLAETIEAKVVWEGATRTVLISRTQVVDPPSGTTTGGSGG